MFFNYVKHVLKQSICKQHDCPVKWDIAHQFLQYLCSSVNHLSPVYKTMWTNALLSSWFYIQLQCHRCCLVSSSSSRTTGRWSVSTAMIQKLAGSNETVTKDINFTETWDNHVIQESTYCTVQTEVGHHAILQKMPSQLKENIWEQEGEDDKHVHAS